MTEEFQRTNPLARGNENIKPLDVYAEHAEIRKQVYDEIKKLSVIFPGSATIIQKFIDCLTPLKNLHDPGRLPIYTIVPRSIIPDKRACVWAVISCLVQAYWEYELDDEEYVAAVLVLLYKLRKINEHYPKMKVVGAENRGYYLEL